MKKGLSGLVVLGFIAGTAVYAIALYVSVIAASSLSRALYLGDLFFTRDAAVAAALAAVCTTKPAIAIFGLFSRNAPKARIAFCLFLVALAAVSTIYALAMGAYYLLFYPAMSILLSMLGVHKESLPFREAELDAAAEGETKDTAEGETENPAAEKDAP